MNKDNIHHIYPTNDTDDHLLETEYDMANQLKCRCKCEPRLEFHHDYDGYIAGLSIIHNSFDGREAVEWANEILEESDKNKLPLTFCVYKKWRIRTPKLSASTKLN